MPSVDIAAIDRNGAPTVLTVPKGTRNLGRKVGDAKESDIRRTAEPLLRAQGYPSADLTLRKQWVDDLGHLHAIFDHSLAGLPIVGGEVRIHFDPDGDLTLLSGRMRKSAHNGLSARAAVGSAIAEARASDRTIGHGKRAEKGRLVFLNSTKTEDLVLAWEVMVTGETPDKPVRDLVYIDAASGEEIERHALIHEALNRQIYDANQTDSWGTLARWETGTNSSDTDVHTNFLFMGQTYSYYSSVFGRDSFDNAGAAIHSTVDYRYNYNNAFWDPYYRRFAFGDGDGVNFGHFTNSRDVVAHEFTHGVTDSTSDLIYVNEPGAINEAMSDIFGAMADAWVRGGGSPKVDSNTWKIGEDVYTPGNGSDALRYMDNPTMDGISTDWYPSRYVGYEDYGGVHRNSGIANLAFKLAVTGGRHPRYTIVKQPLYVPALGADAAQRIFYRANTQYLFPTATFGDLRAQTARAAADLAAAGQVPANAPQLIHLAWDAVAVGGLPTGNSRPINISTQCDVGTGNGIAIAGFVVSGGATPHEMLVRGIGPALGVPSHLPDPYIVLHKSGSVIASNDNWYQASNASQIAAKAAAVGAFSLPNPSLDSSILQTFTSGIYSMHLSGLGATNTGNGMVEIYATDYNNPNHLVNISTRCLVTANPAIAGFVINGAGYKRLLIRAVGPTLGALGVPGVVADPKLTLLVGGTIIRQGDNWGNEYNVADIITATETVGAFSLPSGSKDAAMLVSLPPGSYSAHMSGVAGSTGIGLVEVYEVN